MNSIIKIPVKHKTTVEEKHFYFDCFKRKLTDGLLPCDYSKNERLVELYDSEDNRFWVSIETMFGKVINETEKIVQIHENGNEEEIIFSGVKVFKIKRTNYLYLQFETALPF
nr:hypothetical protein [uncultured Flavobacterium sp.]